MQQFAVLLAVALALAGCATDKAVVPDLEGKPRVKINQQAVPETSESTQPKGSNQHVRKETH